MLTEEQKYQIREEEKFEAEICNKLEDKPGYSFMKVIGGISAVGLLAVTVALAM